MSGYALGELRDEEAEVARLAAQASATERGEHAALVALGLPEAGRVLDVGCGPGFVAARTRRLAPGVSVAGVDVDATLVARAKELGIEAVVADGAALPFDAGAFDFAYARLVLRHVASPVDVVREMARVARRVCLVDADDATLLLHPEPAGFAAALRARHDDARARGADPFVGRRLVSLLDAAGLVDVRATALTLTTGDVGAPAFAGILSPLVDGIPASLLPRSEVDLAAAALRAWGAEPARFGMWTMVLASAARPE